MPYKQMIVYVCTSLVCFLCNGVCPYECGIFQRATNVVVRLSQKAHAAPILVTNYLHCNELNNKAGHDKRDMIWNFLIDDSRSARHWEAGYAEKISAEFKLLWVRFSVVVLVIV